MAELEIPFPLKGLPLKHEITGRVKVDDVLVQTLSSLLGYDGEGRRLLKCSLRGSLQVTSPVVCCITNKVTAGIEHNISFGCIPTTEVLVMANPDNGGRIWLNISDAASVDVGWPLDAGDFLNISLNNLQELRLYTTSIGDKVIVLRTV